MKYIINPKYNYLSDLIHNLPSIFDGTGELIYNSRNQVKLFTVNNEKIVVKRFKKPMLHQRIDYTFIRPSKAKRAYLFGMKLMELNINTPEPIACIEAYSCGLFLQGYFISAFCGDSDARIIREEPEDHNDLIDSIARFMADMHKKGFIHGDANLTNFLYREEADGIHITTIDINRSHFSLNPSKKTCLNSLIRMTHVRLAVQKIVTRYAELRGWDVQSSVDYVLHKLYKFEHHKQLKKKLSI